MLTGAVIVLKWHEKWKRSKSSNLSFYLKKLEKEDHFETQSKGMKNIIKVRAKSIKKKKTEKAIKLKSGSFRR